MTISKNGNVISLNVRKFEFDVIYSLVEKKDYAQHLASVMAGYLDTYESER